MGILLKKGKKKTVQNETTKPEFWADAVIGYSLEVVAFEVWVSVLHILEEVYQATQVYFKESFSSKEGSQQYCLWAEDLFSLTVWVTLASDWAQWWF